MKVWKWVVTADNVCIGIFNNKSDAIKSIQMTWPDIECYLQSEVYNEYTGIDSGRVTLVKCLESSEAGKLTK